MKRQRSHFYVATIILISSLSAFAQSKLTNITGKWQISWEARIGTEQGTLQLNQDGPKLSGVLQSHIGSPRVSGTLDGKNISFHADVQGVHPFTLVFTGVVEENSSGKKMSGKFEIGGVTEGYDWHGENVRPSNYSWTAIRPADPTSADASESAARAASKTANNK